MMPRRHVRAGARSCLHRGTQAAGKAAPQRDLTRPKRTDDREIDERCQSNRSQHGLPKSVRFQETREPASPAERGMAPDNRDSFDSASEESSDTEYWETVEYKESHQTKASSAIFSFRPIRKSWFIGKSHPVQGNIPLPLRKSSTMLLMITQTKLHSLSTGYLRAQDVKIMIHARWIGNTLSTRQTIQATIRISQM